jgi:hypothetical protein
MFKFSSESRAGPAGALSKVMVSTKLEICFIQTKWFDHLSFALSGSGRLTQAAPYCVHDEQVAQGPAVLDCSRGRMDSIRSSFGVRYGKARW